MSGFVRLSHGVETECKNLNGAQRERERASAHPIRPPVMREQALTSAEWFSWQEPNECSVHDATSSFCVDIDEETQNQVHERRR